MALEPEAERSVAPLAGRFTRAALVFAGATAIAACGGNKEDSSTSSASSSTGGTSGSSGKSSSGASGTSGTSGTSGSSGDTPVALYGPAPIDDGGLDSKDAQGVPLYGPPPFDG